MKRIYVYFCMLLCIMSTGCGVRQAGLYTPKIYAPDAVRQSAFTAENMRAAILQASASQGWTVEEAWPGTIEAHLTMSKRHAIHVAIAYDAHTCTLHYRDSKSMAYRARSNGTAAVHPTYNALLKKLEEAIQHNILRQEQAHVLAPAQGPRVHTNPFAMELPEKVRKAVEVEEARQALQNQPAKDLVVRVEKLAVE